MYLLFGDEADHEAQPGKKFFLYGGVYIPAETAEELDAEVSRIRREMGFKPGDSLKFARSSRPDSVSCDQHRSAKEAVIEVAIRLNIEFCAYVALHKIVGSQGVETYIQYGINSILGNFNKYLTLKNDWGVSYLDRLPAGNGFDYIVTWYQKGLKVKEEYKKLGKILSYGITCNGASNFSSVADIVLGSFRYCVNEEDKDISGKAMLPNVVKMMWKEKKSDQYIIREYGLLLRPKDVRCAEYDEEYKNLTCRLNSWMNPQ